MLEIRDIDTWSDRGDIVDSIVNEASVKRDMVNVVRLKNVYGRSQTALVLLPTNQANAIVNGGRIKVSVVSCRVRVAVNRKMSCYRCLSFDHESKECRVTDRSNCCRRHFSKDCTTDETAAAILSEFLRRRLVVKARENLVTAFDRDPVKPLLLGILTPTPPAGAPPRRVPKVKH